MNRFQTSARTLFDALPHVKAEELQPGDQLIHRGRPGCDEGGARPIIRTERYEAEDGTARVRIFLPTERSRWFPDGESATTAKVGQLIALAPPYWPFSETRTITEADVRAARAHVGERAAC